MDYLQNGEKGVTIFYPEREITTYTFEKTDIQLG